MAEHNTLTDPELHEPKGVSTATNGSVYVANGAGSGSWVSLMNTEYVASVLPDISTASSIRIAVPASVAVVGATLVLNGAISTNDANLTFFNGESASLGSILTIPQSGSAAGQVFSFTATTNQNIAGPGYVRIATDGSSDGAASLSVTLILRRT